MILNALFYIRDNTDGGVYYAATFANVVTPSVVIADLRCLKYIPKTAVFRDTVVVFLGCQS
jgi:hypothetical protein